MFIVNVKIASAEGQVALFVETKEAGVALVKGFYDADQHAAFSTTDQRGHTMVCRPRDIQFITIVDLKRDIENQGELALIQAREQEKLNAKVRNDPSMKFLAGLANGGRIGQQNRAQ